MTTRQAPTTSTAAPPTIGGALLLANGPGGWDPPALLLPTPLVVLRFRDGRTRLFAAGHEMPFLDEEGLQPLVVLQQVLHNLRQHLPPAGEGAGKPTFPVAVCAMAYEFGRWFPPHEACFPHAAALAHDEFIASVFIDAYRPDSRGGAERLGYAGSVPAGWMTGAPALATAPAGSAPPAIVPHHAATGESRRPSPGVSVEDYTAALARVDGHLHAGDIYQANVTLPWRGTFPRGAEDLFDAALRRGGACFGGTMILPEGTLLSFSPELLLRRRGDVIQTRPIKGTRPIGSAADAARTAREELEASAKDRAEHVMIVDLARNDLGRVCRPGTVGVDGLMVPIEHPTVMHLESRVSGSLKPGVTLSEIFAAVFPGGSVTGAPKKRAMEVIGTVEQGPRGFYCGAFGWIDAAGDIELNLPIRTGVLLPDGSLTFHTGGGIVADSNAAQEWEEAADKARFFLSAIEEALR